MRNNKLITLLLGGVLATSLAMSSITILADSPNKAITPKVSEKQHGQPPHHLLFKTVSHKLDLSEAQKAQVAQILQVNKADVQVIQKKMSENQKDIRKLILSDDHNKKDKIDKLAKEQGGLVTKMIINNAKVMDEIQHILTPKQVDQLKPPHQA